MDIPVYSSSGNLVHSLHMSPADIDTHTIHFARIVRNRRGHITRAYLRTGLFSLSDRPSSRIGITYLQSLDSGHVWAMRTGSGSVVVA
jgi:hypothetical protein